MALLGRRLPNKTIKCNSMFLEDIPVVIHMIWDFSGNFPRRQNFISASSNLGYFKLCIRLPWRYLSQTISRNFKFRWMMLKSIWMPQLTSMDYNSPVSVFHILIHLWYTSCMEFPVLALECSGNPWID